MPEETLHALGVSRATGGAGWAAPARSRAVSRPAAWWLAGAVVIGVSAAVIAWARTAPSYDAFGWLVWGFQTLHGHLDLGGAPSWKPLPYVFTLPYALFAMPVEKYLWQLTCVSISLGGSVVAGHIAYRLTLRGGAVEGRGGAIAAGVFAGLTLLGIEGYTHYILSGQSDPMIVGFTLAAIDAQLSERPRTAVVCGTLAALGRPEAWPFLGLYGLWCWIRVPRTRWLLIAGVAAILFGWFGIPAITNGRPFVSAQLAFNSPRELRHDQVFGTLRRFHELHYLPVWIAAAAGAAWAAVRRDRVVLTVCGIAAGWVIVEIAFALHGWPALPRYMFEAGGVVAVIAGVAVGWALTELPRLRGVPVWAAVLLVGVLVAALVPGAVHRVRAERTDLRHERGRGTDIGLLANAIARLGGWRHIRDCAKPVADVEWVSSLAWSLHIDVGLLGRHPAVETHRHRPVVIFTPLRRGGWAIRPYHLRQRDYAACRSLRADFARVPGRPGGALLPG